MSSPRGSHASRGGSALLLVIIVAVASHGVPASADDASNSTAASRNSYQPWMACMRANTVGDVCDIQSICMRCLRTDVGPRAPCDLIREICHRKTHSCCCCLRQGCAFDTLMRECVLLPEDGRAMYASSSNALLNRTNLHYCSESDPQCGACAVTASNPFCEGSDGSCVCPSMCASMRSSQLLCNAHVRSSMMYIAFAVLAVVLPLLAVIHRFFTRGCTTRGDDLHAELRRMREERQQRQRQRPPSALALQLEAWRTHRDAHKVEVNIVEPLKGCYVLMEEGVTTPSTTGAPPVAAATPADQLTNSSGSDASREAADANVTTDDQRPTLDAVPLSNVESETASRRGHGLP
jgi:hypothetical protein